MKISVIMPTYNDADSLVKTIESLLSQSYENFEVIIMDDGSTDNTKEIVNSIKDKRINYFYKENEDQLNAILSSLDKITGDYIYILHSDDLLPNNNFFEDSVKFMKENECDAFIGDLIIINEKDEVTGYQKVKKYKDAKYILPLQYLWLGRNLYIDVAFYKKEVYLDRVKNNYLTWNTPHWIDFKKNKIGNIKNAPFPILKYRVFEGNYINSEIGKLNVINGELRTLVNLMKDYNLPLYKAQYLKYRVLNKLGLESLYRPLYNKCEEKNKYEKIKFVIEKRFNENYRKNEYLNSLVEFYKNENNRSFTLNNKIDKVYFGKDMRLFNKKLVEENLEKVYYELFSEMKKGFNKIIVINSEEKEKMEVICEMLCIHPFVKVEVRK